jgi:hypothetical protein
LVFIPWLQKKILAAKKFRRTETRAAGEAWFWATCANFLEV